jgi:hypothetical protein
LRHLLQNEQWLSHRVGRLYANIRSVIETARRRAITALEAIRFTLDGKLSPPRRSREVSNYR